MEWTVHSIKVLEHGYKTGQAASSIANLLGTTKGAVVGKAQRLKFKHPNAVLPKKIKKCAAVEEARAAKGKCQYPHGNPQNSGFHFCHWPVKMGSSYCVKHHNICHRTK